MAKQCDQCGKILPSDTARYCTSCGNDVVSSRSIKRMLAEEPPDWMKQLENKLSNDRSKVSLPELRVKVWEQEETKDSSEQKKSEHSIENEVAVVDMLPTRPIPTANSQKITTQSNHTEIPGNDEKVVDEFPTEPLVASVSRYELNGDVSHVSATDLANEKAVHNKIEEISTRPHTAQASYSSPMIGESKRKQDQAIQAPVEAPFSPALQIPVTPVPLSQTQFSSAQPIGQTPPALIPVPPLGRSKRKNRKRLAIVFLLLFILFIGGAIGWVYVYQPFTVPEITKTSQTYQNTTLGVSLQYPQKWKVDVNTQKGTIYFYDDNHTDQVNITVSAINDTNMKHYISKTATSFGITSQKIKAPLSFSGASWQKVQGSVQQDGANYTATLLVTEHNGRYYTILQQAPTATASIENQLVFSKMRSSFQFL